MIVRFIMFIGAILLFALITILMYGDLKANRRKIDRSTRKKKNQFNDNYQKSYK